MAPGIYFRLLRVGYFEGIDSERGIAWRAADSWAVRSFLDVALSEAVADHWTISRTRRLIDLETQAQLFTWGLARFGPGNRRSAQTRAIAAPSAARTSLFATL